MKKRKYHVIKYVISGHYYVVYIFSLNDYVKLQDDLSGDTEIKLIKVFDDRNEAVAFRKAINFL